MEGLGGGWGCWLKSSEIKKHFLTLNKKRIRMRAIVFIFKAWALSSILICLFFFFFHRAHSLDKEKKSWIFFKIAEIVQGNSAVLRQFCWNYFFPATSLLMMMMVLKKHHRSGINCLTSINKESLTFYLWINQPCW